jgi:hypothetical protein
MTENDQQEMLEGIYKAILERNGEMLYIKTKLENVGDIGKELKRLHDLIIGDGTAASVGLVNEIRIIQKWIDARAWFERILIVAIAAELIALLFLAIKVGIQAA